LRAISRDTVEGAFPSRTAIDRIELPAQSRREISSRSWAVNTRSLRLRATGAMPPLVERNP
jgi:hypothetical protein